MVVLILVQEMELVKIWRSGGDETPAKHAEVVYREGNAYLLLDSGKDYEPYVSYRKNGREIWQEGAALGGAGDDFVLYSLPMHSIVYRISPTTGDVACKGALSVGGGSKLQGMTVKDGVLTIWVDGKKFTLREEK